MKKTFMVFTVLMMISLVWGQYSGTGLFTQINDLSGLQSDTYYVFYGINGSYTGAMTNTISGGRLGSTAVTPAVGTITNPSVAIVWYLSGDDVNGYTVYNEEEDVYCEITANSTSGFSLNTLSTHEYVVTVNSGEFSFASNHASANNRCISIYQSDWRPYLSPNTLHLYKLNESGAVPPLITNIVQTPATDITSSTTVSVSADVTAGDAALDYVELHWGTTSGSLTNTIAMSSLAGDTFTTDSDIPAQTDGTTVYYEIYAVDVDTEESTSAEQSYTVSDPATTALPYLQEFTSDLGNMYTYNSSGAQEWGWTSFGNPGGSANMSGYSGGAQDNVDWLITPAFDFTGVANPRLNFDEAINYGTGNIDTEQEVYISLNYGGLGDPALAAWTKLTVTSRASGGSWDYVSVDEIDLAAYSGESSVHIGFKYTSTSSGAATWQVDNISVIDAAMPMMNVNPEILSGFSYLVGEGPSDEQSFTASGENLTENVTITPPANYEISTGTGGSFVVTDPITLTPDGSNEINATIYVRLTAGLAVGDYNNEDIVINSDDFDAKTVTCNGSVTEPSPYDYVETFATAPATGSSYTNTVDPFEGSTGFYWSFVQSRTDIDIDGVSIMLGRNRTPQAYLESETITGGIGILNFDYMQVYSTGVNLNVEVNGSVVGNVTSSGQQSVVLNSGDITVDTAGDFVIKFINVNNSDGQVAIDNVSWTVYDEQPAATATENIPTGNDIEQEFGGTNVTLGFGNVSTGGDITVDYYGSAPADPSFMGTGPLFVSAYRWVIDGGTVVFTGGQIQFLIAGLAGIGDPSTVTIYYRATPGAGDFDALVTTSDGTYLSAPVASFSEFILGSDDPDNPLPVTLSSFTATVIQNEFVALEWATQTESNMLGYKIYRTQSDQILADFVSDLIPALNNSYPTNYSFEDHELQYSVSYNYWLQGIDLDGSTMQWGPLSALVEEVQIPDLPGTTVLTGNFPNPFNPATFIRFDVKENETATLYIYNMRGQLIESKEFDAGFHNYEWNAESVSSGVYFYKLQSDSYRSIKKMLLLK